MCTNENNSNYLFALRDPQSHRFRSVSADEFLECWSHYDQDKNGYLEREEIDRFLTEFITSVASASISDEFVLPIAVTELKTEFMDAFDENEDGRISVRELAEILPVEETFFAIFHHETPLESSAKFMQVWKRFDKNRSGYIDTDEIRCFLEDLLHSANVPASDEQIQYYVRAILDIFDQNKDGKLGLSEMARLLPVKENYLIKPFFKGNGHITRQKIYQIFDKYDRNKNKTLDEYELEGFLKDLLDANGEEFDEECIGRIKSSILLQWDGDNDGKIDRDEFVELLDQTARLIEEKRLAEEPCV
ncbi:unnamed protein product [Calicophoron daubneyi]|uniref:EF-hand domain-containing protein n=1 Tax=Calicophoron daubneyi TaxID=300641 RepID=A0AAV2TUI8_CALDB